MDVALSVGFSWFLCCFSWLPSSVLQDDLCLDLLGIWVCWYHMRGCVHTGFEALEYVVIFVLLSLEI